MKTIHVGEMKIRLLALAVILFLPAWSDGGEGRWEDPWEENHPPGTERMNRPGPSPGQWIAEGGLHFFRKYISPVDGDRCPSYPSCSQYGLEAVHKHGALLGFLLTVDRLIHEGVADFILFHITTETIHFNWYVFNLADAAIVVGVGILLYESVAGDRAAKAPGSPT